MLSHVISKDLDGGATEADGRASAPVGPSVATPLVMRFQILKNRPKFAH